MSSSDTRIATVTGVRPYQLQILGESLPLNIEPVVLSTINVGDYVWCQFFDQQLVVLGRIQDGTVPQLGSTEDFNNFVYTGVWNQPLNANADTARNYPIAKAGLLEVFRAKSGGDMIHQRYAAYDGSATYWRTKYQTTWEPWAMAVQSDTGWVTVTPFATGWTAQGSYPPAIRRIGNRSFLRGAVVRGSTATDNVFTAATTYAPTVSTFLGAQVSTGGAGYEVHINNAGLVTILTAYHSGTFATGDIFPLGSASWHND